VIGLHQSYKIEMDRWLAKQKKLGVEAHRGGLGLSIEMLTVDLEIWWW
jgi:hypothetical protein